MTYYMGWCFLVVFFFFPLLLGNGEGEASLLFLAGLGSSWCPSDASWDGGCARAGGGWGEHGRGLCVCQRGRQRLGRGDEDTGRVGVTRGGDRTPVPFAAGWEVGREVR